MALENDWCAGIMNEMLMLNSSGSFQLAVVITYGYDVQLKRKKTRDDVEFNRHHRMLKSSSWLLRIGRRTVLAASMMTIFTAMQHQAVGNPNRATMLQRHH